MVSPVVKGRGGWRGEVLRGQNLLDGRAVWCKREKTGGVRYQSTLHMIYYMYSTVHDSNLIEIWSMMRVQDGTCQGMVKVRMLPGTVPSQGPGSEDRRFGVETAPAASVFGERATQSKGNIVGKAKAG